MASICGVTISGYQKWEWRGEMSISSYYKWLQGIRKLVPELGTIEIQETQKVGFAEWLRRELKRIKTGEVNVSLSERSLDDLLADGKAREVLGIGQQVGEYLREKLKQYRNDLDKDDWIAIVRMVQEGREGQDEWKFADPSVISSRYYLKVPKGTVVTRELDQKIQRIVQSVLDEAQQLEKKKREEE